MLSAVAARKAALAAQQTQTPTGPSPSVPSSSKAAPKSDSRSVQSSTSKRKSSSNKSRQDAKKSKRTSPPQEHLAVDQDSFKSQADVIEMEVSDEESDSDMSDVLEEYGTVVPTTTRLPSIKRAWSPSQPLMNSSDEEIDVEGDPDISILFPRGPTKEEPREDDSVVSTFKPIVGQNVIALKTEELDSLGLSDNTTLVAINAGETLCLLGTCAVAVLHGSLDVLGTTILPSTKFHALYAPRSSPLPVLKSGNPPGSKSPLQAAKLAPRLRPLLQASTVFALQECRSGVEGLGRICRTFEGVFEPARWQRGTVNSPFSIPGLFMVTQRSKELHAYSLPESWNTALALVTSGENVVCGTYVVKGPKNSGKSTFARTLLNRLLGSCRRVAFLECDLGQSEFTPGGMVSLNIISDITLGPPGTHPTLPNYSHFIGSATPRSRPSLYLDAISALVQKYRLDVQSPLVTDFDEGDPRIQDAIPLVVNTMGWSKGLGADLTANIESFLDATHVFDIQASVRDEATFGLPAPLSTPASGTNHRGTYGAYHARSSMDVPTGRIFTLEPVTPHSTAVGYTAADMRTFGILSYFHARFPLDVVPGDLQQITAHSWDTSTPLCAMLPYEVDCSVALDKVILTGAGSEDVVEEEIGRVLNGAVVGLVSYEPGTLDVADKNPSENSEHTTGIPYTPQFAAPSPASSTCIGLAFIRAVSPPALVQDSGGSSVVKTYLQVLSPLPPALIAQSRVVVKGEIELPVWGMLDFQNMAGNGGKDTPDPGDVADVERGQVPFLQWGRAPDGVLGAERKRVRRNLMRRGQM